MPRYRGGSKRAPEEPLSQWALELIAKPIDSPRDDHGLVELFAEQCRGAVAEAIRSPTGKAVDWFNSEAFDIACLQRDCDPDLIRRPLLAQISSGKRVHKPRFPNSEARNTTDLWECQLTWILIDQSNRAALRSEASADA